MGHRDAERKREALLRKLEGIRDGWEAADAYGKGMIEVTQMRSGRRGETGAQGPVVGERAAGFASPGAVFDSAAEAADAINSDINARSIEQNMEHGWLYYQDPQTGKFGYSDPYATGQAGAEKFPLKPTVDGRFLPASTIVVGMGHTHGDYTRDGRRTSKANDDMTSDRFSGPDKTFMDRGGTGGRWDYFTLGTPSGRLMQYSPRGRVTDMVRLAVPPLAAPRPSLSLNRSINPLYLEEDQ